MRYTFPLILLMASVATGGWIGCGGELHSGGNDLSAESATSNGFAGGDASGANVPTNTNVSLGGSQDFGFFR
ncbi:MAG: hypothetical protein AAFS10_17860, partial [Myxococcota bacterium]